jgi:hypothetical protein
MSISSLEVTLAKISAALTAPAAASDGAAVITSVAVDLLPGVESASIVIRQTATEILTLAPTDPLALEADRLQQQLGEGPSLQTLVTSQWTDAPDVAEDARWPLYGPKLAASGYAAQIAAPLCPTSKAPAVLNLYSSVSGGLDRLGIAGAVFASHAAVAWCGAVQLQDLTLALARRKTIGQAIGIVMERYGIGEDAAFAFLTRASQSANIKLRDVAAQIVEATVEGS